MINLANFQARNVRVRVIMSPCLTALLQIIFSQFSATKRPEICSTKDGAGEFVSRFELIFLIRTVRAVAEHPRENEAVSL